MLVALFGSAGAEPMTINLRKEDAVTCPRCDGDGTIDCTACGGQGYFTFFGECTRCDGSGEIQCPNCDGCGEIDCDD